MKDSWRFWRSWHWTHVRDAKKALRAADRSLDDFSAKYDLMDDSPEDEAEARSLIERLGECEDDLALLDQRQLLRSARRWGVRYPSQFNKEAWSKFPNRHNQNMLTGAAVHELKDKIRDNKLMAFGVIVGGSSIIQAV